VENKTEIRLEEFSNALNLALSLFFLLLTAYLLKPVKEVLILTDGNPETRSYTIALQVVVILFVLPIYNKFSVKLNSKKFMVACSLFFTFNLVVFYLLGKSGVGFSIIFFIWLGTFGVLMISQFWAYASQVFTGKDGERIFPFVAIGASLGAWVGAILSKFLLEYVSAIDLIFCGVISILLSLYFALQIKSESIVAQPKEAKGSESKIFEGMKLVAKSKYLTLIAAFVVVLNFCSSTGDFILASIVEKSYNEGVSSGTILASKNYYIGQFYSDFYFWVNSLGLVVQVFVVSRLIKHFGFNIAFIVTPCILLLGYSILAFIPVISLFKVFKITENGLNHSLQSSTLQILYSPTSRQEKYEARVFIDSICWKAGDLLQAATVFIGLNLLLLLPRHFVFLNIALVVLMILMGVYIGFLYKTKIKLQKAIDS